VPFANVHTARQMPPAKCDKIRTQEITSGVAFNYCVRAGKTDVESVHFDAAKFTPAEARAWLEKHDFKTDQFVPAKSGKAEAAAAAEPDLGIAAKADVVEIRASATGTCEIEALAAGDASGLARVRMVGYTGVPMKLEGFHHPVVVDLESLKVPRQQVPILRAHDQERVAGHTDRVDVSPQRVHASGVLSGVPQHTADLAHTAKNGFPWQVSIGAQTTRRVEYVPPGEDAKVNGRVWPGPVLVARGAVLRELSLLPMGADGNTDAGISPGATTGGPAATTGTQGS